MDDNGCVVDLRGPRLVHSTTCMEQNKKAKHKKQQKRGSTIRRRVVRKERAPKKQGPDHNHHFRHHHLAGWIKLHIFTGFPWDCTKLNRTESDSCWPEDRRRYDAVWHVWWVSGYRFVDRESLLGDRFFYGILSFSVLNYTEIWRFLSPCSKSMLNSTLIILT